jgi:cobalt-zinc-cadmium efflux system outer membrane protein
MKRSCLGIRLWFLTVVATGLALVEGVSQEPPAGPAPPPALTRQGAVHFALENNPQLEAVRQQRGLAAAGVIIARTYPYNPVLTSVVQGVSGPAESGITNRVFNEHYVTLQVELRGQGKHRRAAAAAAVTRTEWEVAAQELATAVAVVRAYDTVLYRQKKLDILEETVRLNERIVRDGGRLVELGRIRPADLVVARSELDTARGLRGQGRTALVVARAELRRQLGSLEDAFILYGDLDPALPDGNPAAFLQSALRLRPEVHVRQAAIDEAQARLRLQIADRFGNPSLGPRYELNETSDSFVGVYFTTPLPLLNCRKGEIEQRRAELARAEADLRATEFQVAQAVQAALARLTEARKWAEEYPAEILPNLTKAQQDLERLFVQNEPGVDVLRVIGVQRNSLRAADAYLDARFEVNQALADLAAAVGDPALAVGCYVPAAPAEPQDGSSQEPAKK